MTRALFSISQDVLSSEKQWRKRQLFVNVVDSSSELESVAKLSFTIVSFLLFSASQQGRFFSTHQSSSPNPSDSRLGFLTGFVVLMSPWAPHIYYLSEGYFWCRARFAWRLSGIFHLATEVHTFHQESERSCWKCSWASRPSVHIH